MKIQLRQQADINQFKLFMITLLLFSKASCGHGDCIETSLVWSFQSDETLVDLIVDLSDLDAQLSVERSNSNLIKVEIFLRDQNEDWANNLEFESHMEGSVITINAVADEGDLDIVRLNEDGGFPSSASQNSNIFGLLLLFSSFFYVTTNVRFFVFVAMLLVIFGQVGNSQSDCVESIQIVISVPGGLAFSKFYLGGVQCLECDEFAPNNPATNVSPTDVPAGENVPDMDPGRIFRRKRRQGRRCENCYPGTSGICMHDAPGDNSCFMLVGGMCPVGTSLCNAGPNPGTAQPGTARPGTAQPSTAQPGTTRPRTDPPVTEPTDPATDRPSAGAGGRWNVIYIDWKLTNWNSLFDDVRRAVDAGFNVINLAFLLGSGATDAAQVWEYMNDGQRQATVNYAHNNGAMIMVSAGGATDHLMGSTNPGTPQSYCATAATWAVTYLMDGVDFDMEFPPGDNSGFINGWAYDWLSTCTTVARGILDGAGRDMKISHAPQAPYFGIWAGANLGYVEVDARVGNSIDWYNIQYYNQGAGVYTNYQQIFEESSGWWSETAVAEINDNGIPLNKLVVGKILTSSYGGSGYVTAEQLACVAVQAQNVLHWSAGIMVWMYDETQITLDWGHTLTNAINNGTASNCD